MLLLLLLVAVSLLLLVVLLLFIMAVSLVLLDEASSELILSVSLMRFVTGLGASRFRGRLNPIVFGAVCVSSRRVAEYLQTVEFFLLSEEEDEEEEEEEDVVSVGLSASGGFFFSGGRLLLKYLGRDVTPCFKGFCL